MLGSTPISLDPKRKIKFNRFISNVLEPLMMLISTKFHIFYSVKKDPYPRRSYWYFDLYHKFILYWLFYEFVLGPKESINTRFWDKISILMFCFRAHSCCCCWRTVVYGDQKAPFSIATTPRYRWGRYSFLWNAPLYPWYVPYFDECYARRYQVPFFKVFGMTWPGIESRSPGPFANTHIKL